MIAAGALLLLAGCTGGDGAGGGSTATAADAPPAQVSLALADGSADVSPLVPLEISVTDGKLGDVTLVDGQGAAVPGAVAAGATADTVVFTPEAPLAYGTQYKLTASAANEDKKETTASSKFTTVSPGTLSTPSVGPLDGTTVGVGMPIRVYFDQPVTDKAAVESHLQVQSSTPTDGVWSWLNDSEVHFRPSAYWPADTEVTLNADLYGVDFGDGVWGEKDRTVSFHVGDKHVSVADAGSHTLTVYDGDQVVQTYPMSAGSSENPTRNGPHVVTEMN